MAIFKYSTTGYQILVRQLFFVQGISKYEIIELNKITIIKVVMHNFYISRKIKITELCFPSIAFSIYLFFPLI